MGRTAAAVAVLAAALIGQVGCKPSVPEEAWARGLLVRRVGEIDQLERDLDAILERHLDPMAERAHIAREVEALLRSQNWITGWRAPVLRVSGDGGTRGETLAVATNAPDPAAGGEVHGAPAHTLSAGRRFWVGLYRVGSTQHGGVELQTSVRRAGAELTLHLYLLPRVRQIRQ